MSSERLLGINLQGGNRFEQHLEMLSETGWNGFFTGWYPEKTGEITRASERLGLRYLSIHAPFDRIESMWQEGSAGRDFAQGLIDCIHDCADHGVPVAVIHPFKGFLDHTPTKAGLENYALVVKVAEDAGVRIGFENVEGEEYLAALMETFGDSPACGFCFDTGHELCYNGGKDLLGLYGEKLCFTHFNDNLGVYDPQKTWQNDFHLTMGDGIVDWLGVMDRIDALGYKGALSCELLRGSDYAPSARERYGSMEIKEFYAFALNRMRAVVERRLRSEPIRMEASPRRGLHVGNL
ncbi:MAG: sugar phosphate isomerase/epimerase [Ruminococcaceae bacterium]|nr:sugar phosphate isomerase/epimerase [Oscillospiraceae bacterium]